MDHGHPDVPLTKQSAVYGEKTEERNDPKIRIPIQMGQEKKQQKFWTITVLRSGTPLVEVERAGASGGPRDWSAGRPGGQDPIGAGLGDRVVSVWDVGGQ